MLKFISLLTLAVVSGFALGVALGPGPERTLAAMPPNKSARSAEVILAEHDAIELPSGFLDDERVRALEQGCRRKCDLAREMADAWPQHPRVPSLLEERWALLENTFAEHDTVLAETVQALERSPSKLLARKARHARAWSAVHAEHIGFDECLAFVDETHANGAADGGFALMLEHLARARTADPSRQRELLERIANESTRSDDAGSSMRAWRLVLAQIDAPLDLDFVDQVTRQRASLAKWAGRPLLIAVQRAFDWQPLPESELLALEARHARHGVVGLQLVVGHPATPVGRADRLMIAPEDDPLTSFEMRHGLHKTPVFLVVDGQGILRGASEGYSAAERWLEQAVLSGR